MARNMRQEYVSLLPHIKIIILTAYQDYHSYRIYIKKDVTRKTHQEDIKKDVTRKTHQERHIKKDVDCILIGIIYSNRCLKFLLEIFIQSF